MNKLIFSLPLILIIFVAGCASYGTKSTTTAPTVTTGTEHTVEMTATGFSPNTLTIKVGDKVTFVSKDNIQHWPASVIHPTHCEYKGCNVFDSRKGLSQGESYSIVFDLAGNWKYHNHLNPGLTGTIVVQ